MAKRLRYVPGKGKEHRETPQVVIERKSRPGSRRGPTLSWNTDTNELVVRTSGEGAFRRRFFER